MNIEQPTMFFIGNVVCITLPNQIHSSMYRELCKHSRFVVCIYPTHFVTVKNYALGVLPVFLNEGGVVEYYHSMYGRIIRANSAFEQVRTQSDVEWFIEQGHKSL